MLGEDVRYVKRPYKFNREEYNRKVGRPRLYAGMTYAQYMREGRQPSDALVAKWQYPSNPWSNDFGRRVDNFAKWRKQAVAKNTSRGRRPVYNKYDAGGYKASVAKTYKKTVKPGLLRWAHRAKRAIKSKQKKAKLMRKEVKRTRRFARRHM